MKLTLASNRQTLLCAALGALLGLPAGVVRAADLEYPVGGMVAYPVLSAGIGYDASAHYDEEGDAESDGLISLKAGGGLQGERRNHTYGIEYVASQDFYFSGSSPDSVLDQRAVAYWGTAFDRRNNVDLGIEYRDDHDPRGEEDPITGSRHTTRAPEPDKWTQTQAGATYLYGAEGARGLVRLSACQTCRRYQNNYQEYRDNDILDMGATLYVRQSPKTYWTFSVIQSDFDYLDDDQYFVNEIDLGSLDSMERRYLVGMEWDATRKVSGRFRVGWLEKDFDDPRRTDYDDYTADATLFWSPRSFSTFTLDYQYRTYEAIPYVESYLDDYIQVQQVDLNWRQQWQPRLTSFLGGYMGWDNYEPSGRNDERYGAAVGLDYLVNRWMSVGIAYDYEVRDSSWPEHDYDDGSVSLYINIGDSLNFGWGQRGPDICDLR